MQNKFSKKMWAIFLAFLLITSAGHRVYADQLDEDDGDGTETAAESFSSNDAEHSLPLEWINEHERHNLSMLNKNYQDNSLKLRKVSKTYRRLLRTQEYILQDQGLQDHKSSWVPIIINYQLGITNRGILGQLFLAGNAGIQLTWMRTDLGNKFPIRPFLMIRRPPAAPTPTPTPTPTPAPISNPTPNPTPVPKPSEPPTEKSRPENAGTSVTLGSGGARNGEAAGLGENSAEGFTLTETGWKTQLLEMADLLAKVQPKLKKERLKKNLLLWGADRSQLMAQLNSIDNGSPWWLSQVWWNVTFTIEGDVIPGLLRIGGDFSVRVTWMRAMKTAAKPATLQDVTPGSFASLALNIQNSLDQAENVISEGQTSLLNTDIYQLNMIWLRFTQGVRGNFGLATAGGSYSGHLQFNRNAPKVYRRPVADRASETVVNAEKNANWESTLPDLAQFDEFDSSFLLDDQHAESATAKNGQYAAGTILIVAPYAKVKKVPLHGWVEDTPIAAAAALAANGAKSLLGNNSNVDDQRMVWSPADSGRFTRSLVRARRMARMFYPRSTRKFKKWELWRIAVSFTLSLDADLFVVTLQNSTSVFFHFHKQGL